MTTHARRSEVKSVLYWWSLQKIFLDTTRLLADNTDNIVDELWNYIKEGRLVHAAILLLAAQRKIRTCASSNRNISCNLNGFDIIRDRVMGSIVSIEREGRGLTSGKNSKAHKQLEEKRKFFHNSLMLIFVISKTGEALDEYIQSHSEVHIFCQVTTWISLLFDLLLAFKKNGAFPIDSESIA